VPAHIKRRAQRIVTGRNGTDVRDAAVAPLAHGNLLDFDLQGAVRRTLVRQQSRGKLYADRDGHKEIGQQQRQQQTRNFQYAARATPADAIRVIKYGSAFLHEFLSVRLQGRAGRSTGLRKSPSTPVALLPYPLL